jgi:hypothetical protein
MEGLILFSALGGELFVRYRVRFPRLSRETPTAGEAEAGAAS